MDDSAETSLCTPVIFSSRCPSCKRADDLTESFGHAAVSLLVLAHPSVNNVLCSRGIESKIEAVCFKVCTRCYKRMNKTLKHAREKYPQFHGLKPLDVHSLTSPAKFFVTGELSRNMRHL
jgi:hypothetical protein